MAFTLKLASDTTTVDFIGTSSNYRLADGGLEISAPKKKQIWGSDAIFANGASLIASSFENREVAITFQVSATTRDGIGDALSTIENMLEAARRRSINQYGQRIELQYQWDSATNVSYFDVIDGEIVWPDDVMSVDQVHQKDKFGNWVIYDFTLTLVVFPFTYSTSLVSGSPTVLTLENSSGAAQDGVIVFNHWDDGTDHENWVEFDPSEIDGDYSGIVKLTLRAESGESEKTSKVIIGHRVGNLDFTHVLEDEDADYVIGSVSPTTDTDVSSGDTYTILSATSTSGEEIIRWDLSATQTEKTQGPFRLFGKTALTHHWSQSANFRIVVKYGSAYLYEGEWRKPFTSTTELLDFGTFFLPPWLVNGLTNLAGISLAIEAKLDSAGTVTTYFDCLYLMPQDGGYRTLEFRSTGATQFDFIVDDGWTDTVYYETAAGYKAGIVVGLMPRLALRPAVAQRFYFLMLGTSENCDITRQLKVVAEYVPVFNTMA